MSISSIASKLKNRNGQRLSLAIPVRVSGSDTRNKAFTEDTRTSEINRTGARVCLSRELAADATVQVALLGGTRAKNARARVVWVKPAEASGYWNAGLELQDVTDFWGIQFPSDGEWKPKGQAEEAPAATARAAQETSAASVAPEQTQEAPAKSSAKAAHAAEQAPAPPVAAPAPAPSQKAGAAPAASHADLTDLLNSALSDAVQENIRNGLGSLSSEAERQIEEVKREALKAAEEHLRGTIASCGEDLEMRAIEMVGRNEQSLEQAASDIVRRTEKQIEERVQDASTRAAEAIQQMLDMANIGCTRLKQDAEQTVNSTATAIRQKLDQEVPQIEDQLVEQCQARTGRLLNNRLEEAETGINTRLNFLSHELGSRTEEMLARFELEMEKRYSRLLNEHTGKLDKQLAETTARLEKEFTTRMAAEMVHRQEEMLKELEARANSNFTLNLNRTRRALARSVRELGEALQEEAEGFTGSSKEPA